MRVGYARVSTLEQDNALQISALKSAGCSRIVEEKRSAVKHRPALEVMLSELKQGDVLVIYKLDRLARSLSHLLQIIERVQQQGATLKSLTEPIDPSTPAGRMFIQVLGSVAEFERSLIRERCMAGLAEAIKAGRPLGRPFTTTLEDRSEIVELVSCGMPSSVIAEAYGLSRSRVRTLYLEATGRKQRGWGVLRRRFMATKDLL